MMWFIVSTLLAKKDASDCWCDMHTYLFKFSYMPLIKKYNSDGGQTKDVMAL